MNAADKNENRGLWQKRYETFIRLYKGRTDAVAERKEDGSYAAVKGEGLTYDRFMAHVLLKQAYAIYNMDDQRKVNFGLFDVDVFPRKQEWPSMLAGIEEKRKESFRIIKTLMDMGLKRGNILVEFPTVGFHILIFFNTPVDAQSLKNLMKKALEISGLAGIPFYPKKIEDNPYGDRVQLPLRINLNTSRRSNFVRDLEAFDPERYSTEPDFSVLEEIEPIDGDWVKQA